MFVGFPQICGALFINSAKIYKVTREDNTITIFYETISEFDCQPCFDYFKLQYATTNKALMELNGFFKALKKNEDTYFFDEDE